LAQPYLLDQKVTKELLDEAWERSRHEVSTSHILISLAPDAPPGDTLIAYERAMKFKKRLKEGEDFGELASEVSDDPSAKANGGDLGFYSVFDLVYPFETAAYKTPVGEVSDPVRTEFGYHLVKVNDRIPTRGQIKVAVILKSSMYGMQPEEYDQIKKEIYEIYDKLQAGEDFAEIAKKYSDDKNSGSRGGQLPWFGVGNKPKDFEKAAFSLKNIGDVSEPVQTEMGWYIFKLLDRKIPTREETMPVLERRIARDAARSAKSKEVIVEKLKKDYNFKVNKAGLEEFYRLVDPSIFSGRWDPNPALQKKGVLFTLDGKNFLQSDFARYLALNMKESREKPIAEFVDARFEDYVSGKILEYESTRLEDKYPEFRDLYKEFRDGNLLFEIMDKKVWSKASSDSAGLQAFYKANKENYLWGERLNGSIIYCKSSDHLDKMAEEMQKAVIKYSRSDDSDQALEEVLDEVARNYNGSFEIVGGPFLQDENDIIDAVKWKKGVSDIIQDNDSRIFVWVRSILEPMPKTLDEARGQITADYQEYLDREWIKELRGKYSVKVNEEVLQNIQL
jgi:peptidyl-prolyl cis-trans isomerase SurA